MTVPNNGSLASSSFRLGLVIAAAVLISGVPRSSFAQHDFASTASITVTSQRGDTVGLGDGKTVTYSTSGAKNYTVEGQIGDLIGAHSLGYVETPNELSITMSPTSNFAGAVFAAFVFEAPFARTSTSTLDNIPTPLSPGKYVCPLNPAAFLLQAHTAGASFNPYNKILTGCSSGTGSFTINSISITTTQDTTTATIPLTVFHIASLDMQFTLQCTGATGSLTGRINYKGPTIAGAVPWDAASVGAQAPEFGTCPDGTTGSGSGSPGGGTTGGNGGPTPTAPTVVFPDNVLTSSIAMVNSDTATVPFSIFIPSTTTSDVTLSAATDDDNLIATITPSVIKPGGARDSKVTIHTTATTLAGEHTVTLTASDGTVSSSASIHVTVFCDPPFILGIDQPKSSTIALGRPAQLSVKASGSGPFTYQWFTGASGLSNFPLPGGTSANFTTSALNDTTSYWVRVTNPCGSVNSQTATVNVSASAKPTGRR